ncbi:hypothetical protein Bint_0494 [Brachyspira intermedia PWS/A]|uniref:Uncharacterized protein n=2 Tax=Brachyspira intermedia TaxID=84377 RepID=G0EJC7_BRAIP|nr:hypothetical protein Bint_0494 [Brachyspira intermedia PWS/A]
MYSKIDLVNMRTVYNKTIDYYDFGTMEHTFDIRGKVKYTNAQGSLAIFSMYGAYQIARTFPLEATNEMNIIMPMTSKDNKIRVSILNNGIKKIKYKMKKKNAMKWKLK